jgi:hypothetical protein
MVPSEKKQAGFRQGAFDVKCALSFRFLFSFCRLKTPPSPWSNKGNQNAHISFVLLNTYTTIEYLPTHDFLQLTFRFYHSYTILVNIKQDGDINGEIWNDPDKTVGYDPNAGHQQEQAEPKG